jgi:predicted metal-dependent phosphoesterase TrpH
VTAPGRGRVDLHTHTTASDGVLAPGALVRKAAEHRVGVLAVTDHDSTGGLAEAGEEAARHGITIVPGLEINCDVEGGEVHVLGYFVDHEAPWFQVFLRGQREERVARVHRLAARLGELGMPIDAAEVFAIVKEGSPGRPHVAQVMVQRGYVRSVREAFDRFLRSGGPASVPRRRLTPREAVAVIRRAGGVPVMAHPGLAGRDDMIPELVQAGLMGIETYYHEHSPSQVRAYLGLCDRLGLVATGGSDYHGLDGGRAHPPGTPRVPWTAWERLQARRDDARRSAPPGGGTDAPA